MTRDELVAAAQAELDRRTAAGRCDVIVEFNPRMLLDEQMRDFLRMTFVLRDGTSFDIDCGDPRDLVRRSTVNPLTVGRRGPLH